MGNTGKIVIEGLRVFAYHGVMTQESVAGNTFEVDATLEFDAAEAMRTDRVELTVNYADAVAIIKEEMQTPSKLLEHVAYRLHKALCKRFPQVTGGSIAVYKLTPPIAAELARIGFTYSW